MITRTALTGLLAGLAGGVVLTLVYLARIHPLIMVAEGYEQGLDHAVSAPFIRIVETALFNILTGAGFGLLLAALLVMRGERVGVRLGVLWGVAGFAVFTLAPGVGLPPELPGAIAASLEDRQVWWVLASAATGCGLALLVFTGRHPLRAAGVALILLPHIVGAPHADSPGGTAPPELAAQFVGVSFGAMALFWVVLGGVAGYCHDRFAERAGVAPA